MASSDKKDKSTIFHNYDIDQELTMKSIEIRVNDIRDIDRYISNLTSEKINDIIQSFLQVMDGVVDQSNMCEKLKVIYDDCSPLIDPNVIYELYYNDSNVLKKYFFIFLSILINDHYAFFHQNTILDNINLRILLRLIHKNDILGKFELINHDHLHLSPYFSLIGTVLIKIVSHRIITTKDLCVFSTILQDDIINKTTSNWPILKDFIQLFRSILHTEFVKNIYFELINDEQELTKIHDGIRFEGKKSSHIT